MKLVECVPNFSEGRDREAIVSIVSAIESVEGIEVLDVDSGADTNRTVVTFVGSPEAVKTAAFQGIATAAEVIDMQRHEGTHPRMGATDVCPFIPVNEVTMKECSALAEEVGKRVGEELEIPVFLYERSARKPERKNLAAIRRGEYEGMEEKLKDPDWTPDYGPAKLHPRAGCTAIGAREFLIAYNINLNTREAVYATDIAFELREKGRTVREGNTEPFYFKGKIKRHEDGRYFCGSCDYAAESIDKVAEHTEKIHGYDLYRLLKSHEHDPDDLVGKAVKRPGKFDQVKAIGWFVEEYDCAQISINLTDYHVTSPQTVYEEAKREADRRGLSVTGSEVVGLIPYQALLEAGKFYLRRQERSCGIPERDILETAIQSLGLRDKTMFDISKKVIGLPELPDGALIAMQTDEFIHEVSRESAAPGGGSVSALLGSLAAALQSMVANLTIGKRGSEAVEEDLKPVAEEAQRLKDALLKQVDADTDAFQGYMEALRLPENSPGEKEARELAVQKGLQEAVRVPLRTAELSFQAMELAEQTVDKGNPNSITDAGVGALAAWAAIQGAVYNVLVNLKELSDDRIRKEFQQQCSDLLEKGEGLNGRLRSKVNKALGS